MKRNIMFGLIAVFLVFALSGIVSAAASISVPSSVQMGADDQERNTTTSVTSFTITNNGDMDLTNIAITTTTEAKYGVQFSLDGATFSSTAAISSLVINQSKTISLRGSIPNTQSTNPEYPTAKTVDIGDITVSSTQVSTVITSFYVSPISKLEVKSVDFTYGTDDTHGVSRGNTADFDYDGQTAFKIEFDVKNQFPSGEDIDIDDADFTVIIENIDDDDDLDKDVSSSSISSGKKTRKTVSFTLPTTIDDGSYKVTIEGSGSDSYGAMQYYNWYGYVDFQRQDRLVKIRSAVISPSELKCTNSATVTVSVVNLGTEYEDHAAVTLNSSTLGVSAGEAFELSDDSSSSASKRTLSFPINIANVQPGTYSLGVNAYASDGNLWTDYVPLTVTVKACDGTTTTTPPPTTTSTNTTIIPQPANTQGQIIGQPVEETSTSGDSIATIALLAIGALVVMIIIIVLLVKLIK